MNKYVLKLFLVIVVIVVVLYLLAANQVNSQQVIECNGCADCSSKIQAASTGDTVLLTQDIAISSGVSCVDFFGTDDVTFDCGGYSISANDRVIYGIYSGGSSNGGAYRNTISNCTMIGFDRGIYLSYGGNNTVQDSTFMQNDRGIDFYSTQSNIVDRVTSKDNNYAIELRYNSDNNIIKNSYLMDNSYVGISFSPHQSAGDPENNLFYNNYISNDAQYGNIKVVRRSDDTNRPMDNSFSTSLDCSAGPSILGCNCIGGNYWSNSVGTEFSDTCFDLDGNGICDLQYDLSSNGAEMYDLLPLTENSSCNTSTSPPDIDMDGMINSSDLIVLKDEWGSISSSADFNQDESVNIKDLSIMMSQWTN